MGTFLDIITAIQDRTGYDGAEYTARIKRAINWAKDEINTVNWKFLLKRDSTTIETVAGDILYSLPTDFARFESIFILPSATTYTQLHEAHEDDIFIATSASQDIPKFYSIYGTSATTPFHQRVAIGMPTASDAYTVVINYYLRMDDLVNDADICMVSSVYRDEPLISGGLYKFHKDLDEHDIAPDAFKDFMLDMSIMESELAFNGESYRKLIAGNNE